MIRPAEPVHLVVAAKAPVQCPKVRVSSRSAPEFDPRLTIRLTLDHRVDAWHAGRHGCARNKAAVGRSSLPGSATSLQRTVPSYGLNPPSRSELSSRRRGHADCETC
ncbi:hypothetical protein GCM10027271_58400 [Saccharopolyspora gloriosae]